MHLRALPALLLFAAASCVHARLDGSTEPGRAFDEPERISDYARYADLAGEFPGETALILLGSGLDAFAARVHLVDRAEFAVDAQYYIFHDDLTGRFLLHRMLAAADRGVRVRLLLDDLGSDGIDELIARANVHPNLEVRLFNPRARGGWSWMAKTLDTLARPMRINRRMHNKLLAMDGIAAIVGGRNVGDEYFDASGGVNFGDLDVLAVGPAVAEAEASFDLYWNSSITKRLDGWSPFDRDTDDLAALQRELADDAEVARASEYASRISSAGYVDRARRGEFPLVWAPTHVVADLPWKVVAKGDEVEETMLMHRVGDALPAPTRDLMVVSPYFVPRESGVEQLCARVDEGVRVRVLTNSLAATDVPIVHAGYDNYRKDLLAGGVEIHELMPVANAALESHEKGLFGSQSASLHAKTYVVDERWVFVGSMNLDPRSVELNTELGFVCDSPELAAQVMEGVERVLRPDSSWTLSLTDDGWIRWHGERDGASVVLAKEPDSTWWQRFSLWWMGALPIEGQL